MSRKMFIVIYGKERVRNYTGHQGMAVVVGNEAKARAMMKKCCRDWHEADLYECKFIDGLSLQPVKRARKRGA